MAAVLRVKRKRNEEPVDKLLIACKKLKHSGTGNAGTSLKNDEVKELFKFAGTVQGKADPVTQHIQQALNKERLSRAYKQHTTDVTSQVRTVRQQAAKSSRYKVISNHRPVDVHNIQNNGAAKSEDVENKDSSKSESGLSNPAGDVTDSLCVFDIEEEATESLVTSSQPTKETITCNSMPMVREKVQPKEDGDYVYDIYYTSETNFDFRSLEHILAVEAFNDELVYDDYRQDLNQDVYEEDDDSNDEDNWRNDYPDEEDFAYGYGESNEHPGFDSDGEPISDIFHRKLHVGLGDDLSSDNDEDYDTQPKRKEYYSSAVDDLEDFDDL